VVWSGAVRVWCAALYGVMVCAASDCTHHGAAVVQQEHKLHGHARPASTVVMLLRFTAQAERHLSYQLSASALGMLQLLQLLALLQSLHLLILLQLSEILFLFRLSGLLLALRLSGLLELLQLLERLGLITVVGLLVL
jgi:hypothetical protein